MYHLLTALLPVVMSATVPQVSGQMPAGFVDDDCPSSAAPIADDTPCFRPGPARPRVHHAAVGHIRPGAWKATSGNDRPPEKASRHDDRSTA